MDGREKSFDFAQEVTKQLLALSTGLIALTVTFHNDVAGGATQGSVAMLCSWILLLVSIAAGIWALMGMAGSLSNKPEPSIYDANIVVPAGLQIVTFMGGLIAAVVYGAGVVA